jgi:hypothetical protein
MRSVRGIGGNHAALERRIADLGEVLLVAGTARSRVSLKGARPGRTNSLGSDLRLLRNLQGVVDLDAEIAHGRLRLGVPEQ